MYSALGHDIVGFLAVLGRHNIRPPHFASKVSYSAAPQTFAECSRGTSCRCTASALLFGLKPRRDFPGFWTPYLHGLGKSAEERTSFSDFFCDKRNAPLPQSRFMPTFFRQVRLRLGNVKTRFAIALTLHWLCTGKIMGAPRCPFLSKKSSKV